MFSWILPSIISLPCMIQQGRNALVGPFCTNPFQRAVIYNLALFLTLPESEVKWPKNNITMYWDLWDRSSKGWSPEQVFTQGNKLRDHSKVLIKVRPPSYLQRLTVWWVMRLQGKWGFFWPSLQWVLLDPGLGGSTFLPLSGPVDSDGPNGKTRRPFCH